MDKKLIKQVIIEKKLMDSERLRELESLAASSKTSLIQSIFDGGYIKEDALLLPLAEIFGIDYIGNTNIDESANDLILDLPDNLKKSNNILPISRINDEVIIAITNPQDVELLDELRYITSWKLTLRLASSAKIAELRDSLNKNKKLSAEEMSDNLEFTEDKDDGGNLEDLANEAPIVKIVNLIIMQAISVGCSDIHIEPFENFVMVRYRVDGVLRKSSTYPVEQYPAIISRIKIVADLNIAERRVPQDGRISIKLMDKVYDLRVATVPSIHGEGVVMRILDKGSISVELEALGFRKKTFEAFQKQISKSNGIVLVTGPTGSGKSTSLYAALAKINTIDQKIITVEDPVEYELEGLLQIPVNAKVGMTFAAALRSILRLDPDIIMLGEIRDTETATIAIRAALTGHLVFSTLHTNDSVGAVSRLIDMGIPSYLVASSMNGILAQRLVRKNCKYCRDVVPVNGATKSLFTSLNMDIPETITIGKGCDECDSAGYAGRLGLYELFEVHDDMRLKITNGIAVEELREIAYSRGMETMKIDGAYKILQGDTTAEEVIRVTQD